MATSWRRLRHCVVVVCVVAMVLVLVTHYRQPKVDLQDETTLHVLDRGSSHQAEHPVKPIWGAAPTNLLTKAALQSKRFRDSRATRWTSDKALHRYLTSPDVSCKTSYRVGHTGDGGWDVCVAGPYVLNTPCLVYSFGINWDFSFDDAIVRRFNCQVKAFDPSMNKKSHKRGKSIEFFNEGISGEDFTTEKGWNMYSLGTILKKHNDMNKIIDYFKMDVELSEYDALPAMATQGLLTNIKQIGLEIHRLQNSSAPVHLINLLEDNGFRKWKMDYNFHCAYKMADGTRTSTCIELYYINMRFIDEASIGSFLIS